MRTTFTREGAFLTALTAWLPMAAAALALLAGCDNRHFLGNEFDADNGSPNTHVNGGTDSGIDQLGRADAGTEREVGTLGPSLTWSGYIENYQFPSGSDAVTITFATDPAGLMVGTVTLGNGTPPPAATDPDAYYPPGVDLGVFSSYVAEGDTYTIQGGTRVADRIRFALAGNELWAGWCALQTPVDDSNRCGHNWPSMSNSDGVCAQTNPANNQIVPISCPKLFLCWLAPVCECAAGACGAALSPDISFDLAIVANQATGSVEGRFGAHNIHLTYRP